LTIEGEEVKPKQLAKILGVVMDTKLKFREHMARAAIKGLSAAMCLRRLKMLSSRTARQLFMATVAPAMDYASDCESQKLLLDPPISDLTTSLCDKSEGVFPTTLEPRAEQPAKKVVTGTTNCVLTTIYDRLKRTHNTR
jgi:hypothetical protein